MPANQRFTLLDCWLIERIDADQAGGNDGFEHEVHHQRPERRLVRLLQTDRADRPVVTSKGFHRSPGADIHQIPETMAREIGYPLVFRKCGIKTRAIASHGTNQDGDELIGRTVEIELQLAVLIDRPKSRDRGCSFATLSQAFGPKLSMPVRKIC